VFSNGLRWPGDSSGETKELVNCNCSLDYAKEAKLPGHDPASRLTAWKVHAAHR
jgi:hypothetical protein